MRYNFDVWQRVLILGISLITVGIIFGVGGGPTSYYVPQTIPNPGVGEIMVLLGIILILLGLALRSWLGD